MISNIVVDASAVLKLLLNPAAEGERLAERIGPDVICAPTILPYEVTNVIRRRWSAGLMTQTEASLAMDSFRILDPELWQWATVEERVWELKGSMTVYNASYIALAELLNVPLLTADAKLAAMAPVKCRVELV